MEKNQKIKKGVRGQRLFDTVVFPLKGKQFVILRVCYIKKLFFFKPNIEFQDKSLLETQREREEGEEKLRFEQNEDLKQKSIRT